MKEPTLENIFMEVISFKNIFFTDKKESLRLLEQKDIGTFIVVYIYWIDKSTYSKLTPQILQFIATDGIDIKVSTQQKLILKYSFLRTSTR